MRTPSLLRRGSVLAAVLLGSLAAAGAATATPVPPTLVCTAGGGPILGAVATQGPIACAALAVPGVQVDWTSASPKGAAAGSSASPAGITFAGGGDGAYAVSATQTNPLDPIPPVTSGAATMNVVLDTQPPTVPAPTKPGDGGRVSSVTPELGWDASADAGVGVDHYVVTLDGAAQGPTAGTRFRVPSPLAQGPHTWQVAAVDGLGRASAPSAVRHFTVDTLPPQATVSPPDGATDVGPLPTVEVAFNEPVKPGNLRLCPNSCATDGPLAAAVEWSAAGATLVPDAPLGNATRYQVQVSAVRDMVDNPMPTVATTFTTAASGGPPGPVTGLSLTPGIARIGLEFVPPSDPAVARIRVLRRAGVPPAGPTDPAAWAFDVPAGARAYVDTGLSPGVRFFYALYSVDASGRFAGVPASGSAVPTAPADPPEPAGTAGKGGTAAAARAAAKARAKGRSGLLVFRTRLLAPRQGALLSTLRPVLRWHGQPKAARLVNLQLFVQRSDRRGITKVLSRFPTGHSFRVPAGILKPGRTYLWRVWPWVGGHYSPKALAQSTFRVKAAPAGGRAASTRPARRAS